MQIIKLGGRAREEAVDVLSKGGLIIYPTETLYGAGVDATNCEAVRKLTEYKERPLGKPYSVAVDSVSMAEDFGELNQTAKNLIKEFLPGPLTVVVRGKHKTAPGVESEDGKLGIRIPDYKFVQELLKSFRKPITATSANASYKKRPYRISDILDNLSQKQMDLIDLIIDAGTLPTVEPSTVIDTTLDEPATLRQGEIKLSEELKVLSRDEEATKNIAKEIWQKYCGYKGKRSIVFALDGEMGAGKTIFTKGLAQAMGITELVTSPTYALENEYGNEGGKLYHFDAWRIAEDSEMEALGFEKLIKEKAVVAVEWAEKVADIIREFDDEAIIIWIKISLGKNENDRLISWGSK